MRDGSLEIELVQAPPRSHLVFEESGQFVSPLPPPVRRAWKAHAFSIHLSEETQKLATAVVVPDLRVLNILSRTAHTSRARAAGYRELWVREWPAGGLSVFRRGTPPPPDAPAEAPRPTLPAEGDVDTPKDAQHLLARQMKWDQGDKPDPTPLAPGLNALVGKMANLARVENAARQHQEQMRMQAEGGRRPPPPPQQKKTGNMRLPKWYEEAFAQVHAITHIDFQKPPEIGEGVDAHRMPKPKPKPTDEELLALGEDTPPEPVPVVAPVAEPQPLYESYEQPTVLIPERKKSMRDSMKLPEWYLQKSERAQDDWKAKPPPFVP